MSFWFQAVRRPALGRYPWNNGARSPKALHPGTKKLGNLVIKTLSI